MRLFGVTGGIGMGKTTAGRWLAQRGVAVVDSDDLARQVVAPGQSALREIQARFGNGVVGPDGRLLREKLAEIIFASESARVSLESILHPRIRALWMEQIAAWRPEGVETAAVVVPLLYEAAVAGDFQEIVCVGCSPAAQRRRLADRGWSAGHLEKRIAAQWPVQRKMERADYVVWTEGPMEVTAAQLARIFG